MDGVIKYFNEEKGYGIIYSKFTKNNIDFSLKDWNSSGIPKYGDKVEFQTRKTSKGGLAAMHINLSRNDFGKTVKIF